MKTKTIQLVLISLFIYQMSVGDKCLITETKTRPEGSELLSTADIQPMVNVQSCLIFNPFKTHPKAIS